MSLGGEGGSSVYGANTFKIVIIYIGNLAYESKFVGFCWTVFWTYSLNPFSKITILVAPLYSNKGEEEQQVGLQHV